MDDASGGDGFTVLSSSTDVGFIGRIDHVTLQSDLEEAWRYYRLPDPVPERDFNNEIVLFFARPDDLCPDDLVALDLVGGILTPEFSQLPTDLCPQPLVQTAYAVAVERSLVPQRFTVFLPDSRFADAAGLVDTAYVVDLTTESSPALPTVREIGYEPLTTVAGGSDGEGAFLDLLPGYALADVWPSIGDLDAMPAVPDGHLVLIVGVTCHETPAVSRLRGWAPYLIVDVATSDGSPCGPGDPYTVLVSVDERERGEAVHPVLGS